MTAERVHCYPFSENSEPETGQEHKFLQ